MALSGKAMHRWYLIHKWTSLICTIFMLMLCLTGLPLIFHEEINQLTRAPEITDLSGRASTGAADLDAMARIAKAEKPGWQLMFLTWDKDSPLINAVLGPTMKAGEGDVHFVPFDRRNGERLSAPPPNEGVMYFLLDLHASMLMGLPGTLFLGLMGIILMLSVISGVVVYAPLMRRLPFATVRQTLSRRIKWLDLHNMIGMVTLAWVSVVSITGIVLTLVTPITAIWQQEQIASLKLTYGDASQSDPADPVSPGQVLERVLTAVPDAELYFMSMPGSPYATPHHYAMGMRGNTPLTEHMVRIALVEAATGKLISIKDTPWYISAINLSIPLHFGDYGGLPLKILWAVLNIAAIIVLGSGLYLWIVRRNKTREKRLQSLQAQLTTESPP